jgi:hypothetical protein
MTDRLAALAMKSAAINEISLLRNETHSAAVHAFANRAQEAIEAIPLPAPREGERPCAWMKGFVSPGTADNPTEYDVECYAGEDPPEGDGWIPLYRRPAGAAP